MKQLPWPFFCLMLGGLLAFVLMTTAQAAAPTGGSDNGCTVIGEVGGVTIAHCVDEANGRELYASSVGFVVVVE